MNDQPLDEPRIVPHVTLAMEVEHWDVRLRDGRTIDVLAHAWAIEGSDCVFSLLFAGAPNVDVPVSRIPLDLLAPLP